MTVAARPNAEDIIREVAEEREEAKYTRRRILILLVCRYNKSHRNLLNQPT